MTLNIPDRIYGQYRTKPKAVAWYGITRTIADEINAAFEDIRRSYDIDFASGELLDVIGRIVVINRNTLANITFDVAECNADGEVECGDSLGAQCMPLSVIADAILSDEYFRTLIRAKISKNNSDGTHEGILNAVSFILGSGDLIRIVDNQDMTFSIEFYNQINSIQRILLQTEDIIPRPQGVRLLGYLEGFNLAQCNGEGLFMCGDELAQCAGVVEI